MTFIWNKLTAAPYNMVAEAQLPKCLLLFSVYIAHCLAVYDFIRPTTDSLYPDPYLNLHFHLHLKPRLVTSLIYASLCLSNKNDTLYVIPIKNDENPIRKAYGVNLQRQGICPEAGTH